MNVSNRLRSRRSPQLISEAQYTLGEAALSEGIANSLQALLPVRIRPIVRHRLVLLDTFNGLIAAAGGRLTARSGNKGEWLEWQPRDGQVRLEAPVTAPVAFAWDLPCGPLRASLEPIIDVRRLMPQVEVETAGSLARRSRQRPQNSGENPNRRGASTNSGAIRLLARYSGARYAQRHERL